MTNTVLENFGFICLVITTAGTFICFVTPYWNVTGRTDEYIVGKFHAGLLAHCEPGGCTWLHADHMFMQKKMPAWFKATQGLMSVGLGLGLIALLVATLSLCCTCHSCNPHHPICGLLLTSCISMAVGIVIFGVKAHDDWGIELEKGLYGSFGWSFWVGIGATTMAFLTACIYCCMGRNRH